MKKKRIQNVIIEVEGDMELGRIYDQVNALHVRMIERGLEKLHLTSTQKIMVIDKIIEDLKSREKDGIIE